MQGLSSDLKEFFLVKNNLLTSAHNDADATDDADDYNRVIGITQLKAFSCANNTQTIGYLFAQSLGYLWHDISI